MNTDRIDYASISSTDASSTKPTTNSQNYYDTIKNYLSVSEMIVSYDVCCAGQEVEIRGFVPNEDLYNTKKEYNKMYKTPTKLPKTTGIIQRGRATIVTWDDGTKTTIVAEEGKEVLDMFHAFCIAFTKKMLGSTTNILKTIEDNDTDAKKKAEAEEIKKYSEERRNFIKDKENAAFERAVREKMYDERVREEAIRRIQIREEKRMNNDET